MVHTMEGLSLKSLLRTVSMLTLQHFALFLLLTYFYRGQSQAMAPPPPVVSMVGGDAELPCHVEAGLDAAQVTVEWGRPDLKPRIVYVWHKGMEFVEDQNTAYKGRVSISTDKLKHGDMSLKLTRLKNSDNGRYRCYIPKQSKEYFVELLVGSVSSPRISLAGFGRGSSSVVLQCESAGWYPEPEVLWLDGEGNVLSAGPTETVRGPDDLYTVSSRVTVEKRHSNKFTCRVQQNNINQTRETWIHVPDDFLDFSSNCAASVAFSVVFGLMLVLAVAFFIWKRRQNKTNESKENQNEEEQKLTTEINKIEHLDQKKAKLDEEFKKNEEEQKNVTQKIDALEKIMKDLKTLKEKLTSQTGEAEKLSEEHEKKMKELDEEVMKKEGDKTVNRPQGYNKLKEIVNEVRWSLEDRKNNHLQLGMDTERIMMAAFDEINKLKEKKNKLEMDKETIKLQIEETEKQKEALQTKLPSDKGRR